MDTSGLGPYKPGFSKPVVASIGHPFLGEEENTTTAGPVGAGMHSSSSRAVMAGGDGGRGSAAHTQQLHSGYMYTPHSTDNHLHSAYLSAAGSSSPVPFNFHGPERQQFVAPSSSQHGHGGDASPSPTVDEAIEVTYSVLEDEYSPIHVQNATLAVLAECFQVRVSSSRFVSSVYYRDLSTVDIFPERGEVIMSGGVSTHARQYILRLQDASLAPTIAHIIRARVGVYGTAPVVAPTDSSDYVRTSDLVSHQQRHQHRSTSAISSSYQHPRKSTSSPLQDGTTSMQQDKTQPLGGWAHRSAGPSVAGLNKSAEKSYPQQQQRVVSSSPVVVGFEEQFSPAPNSTSTNKMSGGDAPEAAAVGGSGGGEAGGPVVSPDPPAWLVRRDMEEYQNHRQLYHQRGPAAAAAPGGTAAARASLGVPTTRAVPLSPEERERRGLASGTTMRVRSPPSSALSPSSSAKPIRTPSYRPPPKPEAAAEGGYAAAGGYFPTSLRATSPPLSSALLSPQQRKAALSPHQRQKQQQQLQLQSRYKKEFVFNEPPPVTLKRRSTPSLRSVQHIASAGDAAAATPHEEESTAAASSPKRSSGVTFDVHHPESRRADTNSSGGSPRRAQTFSSPTRRDAAHQPPTAITSPTAGTTSGTGGSPRLQVDQPTQRTGLTIEEIRSPKRFKAAVQTTQAITRMQNSSPLCRAVGSSPARKSGGDPSSPPEFGDEVRSDHESDVGSGTGKRNNTDATLVIGSPARVDESGGVKPPTKRPPADPNRFKSTAVAVQAATRMQQQTTKKDPTSPAPSHAVDRNPKSQADLSKKGSSSSNKKEQQEPVAPAKPPAEKAASTSPAPAPAPAEQPRPESVPSQTAAGTSTATGSTARQQEAPRTPARQQVASTKEEEADTVAKVRGVDGDTTQQRSADKPRGVLQSVDDDDDDLVFHKQAPDEPPAAAQSPAPRAEQAAPTPNTASSTTTINAQPNSGPQSSQESARTPSASASSPAASSSRKGSVFRRPPLPAAGPKKRPVAKHS